jgi:hypothetical protein
MRDRAWRRYIEDQKVVHRLTYMRRANWWRFKDANNILKQEPMMKDFIGSSYNFKYKTHTTDISETRYKSKYSPNKNCNYYRDGDNREKQRIIFIKILKEYGLK